MKQAPCRTFFRAGELKPCGWLKQQLRIQADGLSGHLDQIWPDVRESRWIGGDREGWERVPYWLDGFIPLAYLLEDPELMERAQKYVDAILAGQQADGWICPCADHERGHYDVWAAILIAKVLTVYTDCSGDERGQQAVYGVMQNLARHLRGNSLFNWGAYRWFEAMIALNWLMERQPEPWMEELAVTLRTQGTDYGYLFDHWMDQKPAPVWRLQTHVVNLSMALKSAAVFWRIDQCDGNAQAKKMSGLLEQYHGMAAGHFTGDECLAGDSPIHGTELCGVVEAMYSYEVLFGITGDALWLDKLEKLAYNALPATISKDMWTHQYLQMTNQTTCQKFNKSPVFYTNGPEANLFGLEPNFGCCTANFNQAWPKLALSAFMKEGEDTILSCVTLPSALTTRIGESTVSIELKTDYPFRDTLHYTIQASAPVSFTLKIHVPANCSAVLMDGSRAQIRDGFVQIRESFAEARRITVRFVFETVLKERPRGLFAVERGPLVYALPVRGDKRRIEYERDGVERKYPYCDYEILPASAWNYAFANAEFTPQENPLPKDFPFSEEQPPVVLQAELVKIDWGHVPEYEHLCAEAPASCRPLGTAERIALIPYGCTTLRMTEMPFAKEK